MDEDPLTCYDKEHGYITILSEVVRLKPDICNRNASITNPVEICDNACGITILVEICSRDVSITFLARRCSNGFAIAGFD